MSRYYPSSALRCDTVTSFFLPSIINKMPIELNPKPIYAIGEHAASGINGCGYGYSNANGIGATSRTPSLYQYQAAQANYAVCSPCSATEEDDTVMSSQTTSSGNVAAAAAAVSPGADM